MLYTIHGIRVMYLIHYYVELFLCYLKQGFQFVWSLSLEKGKRFFRLCGSDRCGGLRAAVAGSNLLHVGALPVNRVYCVLLVESEVRCLTTYTNM